MPAYKNNEWQKHLLAELLEAIRNETTERMKNPSPEPHLTKTDFERIQHVLDEAKSVFQEEYKDKIKASTQGMWPFNTPAIKLPPKFEAVFMEIYKHHLLYPHTDSEVKAAIKGAGGRPYNRKGYDKDDYGDLVVKPDKKLIASQLGCKEKTVTRELTKMVKVGVLKPLTTPRNRPGMYIIGTLGRPYANMPKRRPFIQRTDLREGITAALEKL